MNPPRQPFAVRPYQLMCIVCKLGAGCKRELGNERLDEILRRARWSPNAPLQLRANVDEAYSYQNPGDEDDTPEGELFNRKRDLDILQKLGLVPGATRPAGELFSLLFKRINTARGICGFGEATSDVWKGCSDACSGTYEKGHAMGLGVVLKPRPDEERGSAKMESAAAIYAADELRLRPGHLMCLTCWYGGHLDDFAPIQEDNLFEVIDAIHRNPEIPIRLIRGSGCMICPPCSCFDPRYAWCITRPGASLRNEKKELDVLQRLGLSYDEVMPACRLFTLLFERIHTTRDVCGYGDGVERAPEWRICGSSGPEGTEGYRKGRAAGLGFLKTQ